jgi:hypothetical protein
MLSLLEPHRQMQAILAHGPAALPPGLFAGAPDRILLGLATHANTISHARLIALEESFPRLRALIGEEAFNTQTRSAIEDGVGIRQPLASIGRDFPGWLAARGAPPVEVALAQVELAWLESYHAAEGDALVAEGLAGLDQGALLAQSIAAHPAARLCRALPKIWQVLEMEHASEPWLLIARPDADVSLHPATAAMASMFCALPATIEAALTATAEFWPEADLATTFAALLATGVIAKVPAYPHNSGVVPCLL